MSDEENFLTDELFKDDPVTYMGLFSLQMRMDQIKDELEEEKRIRARMADPKTLILEWEDSEEYIAELIDGVRLKAGSTYDVFGPRGPGLCRFEVKWSTIGFGEKSVTPRWHWKDLLGRRSEPNEYDRLILVGARYDTKKGYMFWDVPIAFVKQLKKEQQDHLYWPCKGYINNNDLDLNPFRTEDYKLFQLYGPKT
jgi:hypothetical protein